MPSAWSVSALALCDLLLDAQLEGLSHWWIQRRVCGHLLNHPSWIIVLCGGRVKKLRAGHLLERGPALSLDNTLTELPLIHGFLPVPAISQVSPVIVIFSWGPHALPGACWGSLCDRGELCSKPLPSSLRSYVEPTLPNGPEGNSGSGSGSDF